jgi:hypothetical protein
LLQLLSHVINCKEESQIKELIYFILLFIISRNNEKYEPLPGKIGLALLEENESKTYRIILYQNKQKPLASVRVTSEFTIIVSTIFFVDGGGLFTLLFKLK